MEAAVPSLNTTDEAHEQIDAGSLSLLNINSSRSYTRILSMNV